MQPPLCYLVIETAKKNMQHMGNFSFVQSFPFICYYLLSNQATLPDQAHIRFFSVHEGLKAIMLSAAWLVD